MFTFIKLKWLEAKIALGKFGWATKYEGLCLERNATTVDDKLKVAEAVIAGCETSIGERRWYSVYLKNHKKA
jgi:hypothetical protein